MKVLPMTELRRIARACAKSPVGSVIVSMPHERENACRLEAASLITLEAMEMRPNIWIATITAAGRAALARIPAKDYREYAARDDIENSFAEAYRAIRERKAAGGKGWEQK